MVADYGEPRFTAVREAKGYAWHLINRSMFPLITVTQCGIDLYDPELRLVAWGDLCRNCQRVDRARQAKERS